MPILASVPKAKKSRPAARRERISCWLLLEASEVHSARVLRPGKRISRSHSPVKTIVLKILGNDLLKASLSERVQIVQNVGRYAAAQKFKVQEIAKSIGVVPIVRQSHTVRALVVQIVPSLRSLNTAACSSRSIASLRSSRLTAVFVGVLVF